MRLLFSRHEIAERAGVCVRTIDAEIQRGRLAAVRLGRRVVITRDAAQEWISALPAASARARRTIVQDM